MSKGSTLPYHLRPNKAVDRELFADLLASLAHILGVHNYRYLGLGGPFLEDFRLLHARTRLAKMVSIEEVENTYKRQKFNKPLGIIECVNDEIGTYLRGVNLTDGESIVWLDMTKPKELRKDIDLFAYVARNVPANSILKLTLNANPDGLGGARQQDDLTGTKLRTDRLGALTRILGDYVPADAVEGNMTHRQYGHLLMQCLRLALENQLRGSGQGYVGLCSFLYQDGQPMVSATIAVTRAGDEEEFVARTRVDSWEFFRIEWWKPLVIDVPVLSAKERLAIEPELHGAANQKLEDILGFAIDSGDLSTDEDSLQNLKRYYRLYPQFGRIVF